MKKINLITFCVGVCLLAFVLVGAAMSDKNFARNIANNSEKISIANDSAKNSATVNQVEGIYIFTDCKPVREYEYLGSVNALTANGYYEQVRSASIKQGKKKYPTMDALIIHDEGKADCIKLK